MPHNDGWEVLRYCSDGHIPVAFYKRNNYRHWTREIEIRDSGGKQLAYVRFRIKNKKERKDAIAFLKQKTKLIGCRFPQCF